MIKINGKKFALNEKEFINSLFENGGTCVGYYKPYKYSVNLYNANKEKIGVINRHKVLCKADKLDKGKYWYSYGTIKEIGEFPSAMEEIDNINDIYYKYIANSLTDEV